MKNDNLLNHVVITSTQCYLRTVNKKHRDFFMRGL